MSQILSIEQFVKTDRPDIVRVTVKHLTTKDGLGTTRGLRVGDTRLVKPKSARLLKIINENSKEFTAAVVDSVDENGKYLGWLYVDLFTL